MHQFQVDAARDALRAMLTQRATGGDPVAARSFIRTKGWGNGDALVDYTKASVSGIESQDVGSGLAVNFGQAVIELSVLSRLGVRRFPPNRRIMSSSTPAIAGIVTEGSAIPVVKGGWSADQITPVKLGAITVASKEALDDPGAEEALSADLLSATVVGMDAVSLSTAGLLDSTSVIDSSVASLAELDTALRDAIDALTASGNQAKTSSYVMPAWLGGRLSLVRGSGGAPAYPEIGALGGRLCGIPVLTYESTEFTSDGGQILLIDGAQVALSDEASARVEVARSAMVEMSSTPTGNSITPTAATINLVSMFDNDTIALRAVLRTGWLVRRVGAVQVIAGVSL